MKKRCIHFFGSEQERENQQVQVDTKNRISNIRRKMSRGAANIFRTLKSRWAWGNKQLWKFGEKGRGKQGHKPPKK